MIDVIFKIHCKMLGEPANVLSANDKKKQK